MNEAAGVKGARCHLSKPQQGGSVPQDIADAAGSSWPLAVCSLGHHGDMYILHLLLKKHPEALRSHEKRGY